MKKINVLMIGAALLWGSTTYAFRHNPGGNSGGTGTTMVDKTVSAGCLPPATSAELNVNNVRALIHSGGDMWWDLIANARYEVPKGSGRNSMYVGTLWIGGRDIQTQTLKVAAQRYRANGVDYWTGPLTTDGTAEIDAETCDLYDQIWTVTRAEVELFRLCNCIDPTDQACDGYQIPESISKWPGNPVVQSNGQHLQVDNILAPFADANNDGIYNPADCDYPYYDLDNNIDCKQDRSAYLYGDFTLFWIFNDKGNIHAESQGTPIGMEIRAQGFGFNTNDEINNMTFYNYQLINRGTTTLSECYFAINTDADLGGANDDYTGCDVQRGFGFMYNGDAFDENFSGQLGYGNNPPAIGIDFFQGPYLDSNGVADFWDPAWNPNSPPPQAITAINGLTDTTRFSAAFGINGIGFDDTIPDNERFGMRRFVYYINGGGVNGDPSLAAEYYNYVRGFWRDGSRMVFGGTGYPTGSFTNAPQADFMFPGDSDPWNWGTKGTPTGFEWREQNTGAAPNTPGDRRFVQSAGPFTLRPGAVNDITIGVVWARASTGDPYESVLKVLSADIKAQSLFDNCFRVLNGPDAPDLNIQELDEELVLYLTNKTTSNNYLNQYEELNYFIPEFVLNSTPITQDTTIFVPSFDLITNAPPPNDSIFVYQDEQPAPYDTLFEIYVLGVPVDSMFGYFSNQSTPVLTQIQIGTQTDSVFYDRQIRFEGYLIYQLSDETVTATDIFGEDGTTKGRLVAQCDIRNFDAEGDPIGTIVNFEFDEDLGYSVPKVKVNGTNEGIVHSFRVTEDQFATGDPQLINHKKYYYMALAYGYNNFKTFDPNDPLALDGQKEPFFLGRRNIKVYTAIPHIPAPEAGGTVLNSLYGFGPEITRIEGRGNGGNLVMMTDSSEQAILNSPTHRIDQVTYQGGMGPIKVKVIDPLAIKPRNYYLKIIDTVAQSRDIVNTSAFWVLLDADTVPGADTVAISDVDISQPYEQIIYHRTTGEFLGFSITISQTQNWGPEWVSSGGAIIRSYLPSTNIEVNGTQITTPGNGLIYSDIIYENPENVWLGFFPDLDGNSPLNFVRSGSVEDNNDPTWNSNYFEVVVGTLSEQIYLDPDQIFQNGISFYGGGGLVPYVLTASVSSYAQNNNTFPGHGLSYKSTVSALGKVIPTTQNDITSSIDLVLTPDRSKWTRCPVFETQDDNTLSYADPNFPNNTKPYKLDLRYSPSVDKDGNPATIGSGPSTNPDDPNYINEWGMGWFPGYAIDIETGERLNIAFGEDSYLNGNNGRDMIFNPTMSDPTISNEGWISNFGDYLFAGKHYIYVFGSNKQELPYQFMPHYDMGQTMMGRLTDGNGVPLNNIPASNARNIWRHCMWTGAPFHVQDKDWLNDEIRIRVRLYKNYQSGYSGNETSASPLNDNNPMYSFSFDGLATQTGDNSTATSVLDLIQIVPNPYYASSDYETTPLDNRVKIVNLPERCSISIYTMSGALIRKFEKGDATTYVEWDLRNFKNIPIATGLYIFHIKADGIGERIIKWYGSMRQIQLDTF